MARYRRRRRRKRFRPAVVLAAVTVLALGLWWFFFRTGPGQNESLVLTTPSQPAAVTRDPSLTTSAATKDPVVPTVHKKPAAKRPPRNVTGPSKKPNRAEALVLAGHRALTEGNLVAARSDFSRAVQLGLAEPELDKVFDELTRLGSETIFSPTIVAGDPFVERYVIQPGDTLGKIAKVYKVSAELLAAINQIRDVDRIRAGQTIKVIQGPFHAVVDKSDFSLDVYLGDTFVKHFKVGLGADGSTPTGEWKVSTKLQNPTYYPPRGGRIIAADDPHNPLSERWIGLEGVSGEATGQFRYGIHGTIDPDSIGRNVSMGCIRMHNKDVEALYTYLIEKYSTVTVQD